MKNQKKFDNIGRQWLKLHPCANDSNVVYLPGQIDFLPVEVPYPVVDTAYMQKQIDSIIESQKHKKPGTSANCKQEINDAYKSGYDNATKEWKAKVSQIKVQAPRVDTIKIYVKDNQLIGLLNNDVAVKDKEIGDLKLEVSEMKGKKNKWLWWFIILAILLAGSTYLNIKKSYLCARQDTLD